MMGLSESLFLVLLLGVAILGTIFWIWALVDCATKESAQDNDKLVWIIIIVFTHLIGALLYFVVRRPRRLAQVGK